MKKCSFWLIVLILGARLICLPVQALALAASSPAAGDAAAFYRGKTMEFVVSTNPGGSYDLVARMLSPLLAKHLGATVIVRNEPGAGGTVALNRLAKENKGLSLFTGTPRGPIVAQIFGEPGVRFDLGTFNWLGTVALDNYVSVVSKRSGYKAIPDLQRAKEVFFAAGSKTGTKGVRPLLMGYIFGINIKVVSGYKGSSDDILALMRGEVDGVTIPLTTILPYIQSQEVIPLPLLAQERLKLLPDVPTIFELKKMSAKEKRIADVGIALDTLGSPVATTPGVPQERVDFLESALKKALGDKELLKKLEKLGVMVDYAPGQETAKAIKTMLSISAEEKAFLGKFLGIEG